VVDIEWPNQGDWSSAPRIRVNTLSGTKPQTTILEIHALAASPDGTPLVVVLGSSDKGPLAALIRPSDGRKLWSERLLRPNIVPPLETTDGFAWSPKNLDIWRSVSRDVALGGDANIFEEVSRLDARDLDVRAIEDIAGQQPETFKKMSRFQLVRA